MTNMRYAAQQYLLHPHARLLFVHVEFNLTQTQVKQLTNAAWHGAGTLCWFHVGPPSTTVAQHGTSTGCMPSVIGCVTTQVCLLYAGLLRRGAGILERYPELQQVNT